MMIMMKIVDKKNDDNTADDDKNDDNANFMNITYSRYR